MKHLLRLAKPGVATWICVGLLAGCATTRIESQWKDPNFVGGLNKGGHVLVLCLARDDTLRRVCEDQWATQLGMQEMTVVRSYLIPGFPPDGAANPDQIKAAAQASGAGMVVSMQLARSDFAVVNPGPQVGFGVGSGGGGYRGGGFSFGGLGISFPVGGATATQAMSASTTLVDVEGGTVIWSGNASADNDSDGNAQVSALTKVTIEALKKAGLL